MFNRILPVLNLMIAICAAPSVSFFWQRDFHALALGALVIVLFNLACGVAGMLRRE